MNSVTLYRIDPARNMRRYYRLDIEPDLFGYWLVTRQWGRIGSSGQCRTAAFTSLEDAAQAFQHQRQAKEKRGYQSPSSIR